MDGRCNGRTYYCSAHEGSRSTSQVSCKESNSPEESVPSTRKQEQAGNGANSAAALKDPPNGAGGFVFGSAEDEVRQTCEKAGFADASADASHGSCEGVAASVGEPARASVTYCGGKACAVSLRIELGVHDRVLGALKRWNGALVDRYGGPTTSESKMPGGCEEDLTACLQDHTANLRTEWRWPTGQKILLTREVKGVSVASMLISYMSADWSKPPAPPPGL
jgi:hypothetical protein